MSKFIKNEKLKKLTFLLTAVSCIIIIPIAIITGIVRAASPARETEVSVGVRSNTNQKSSDETKTDTSSQSEDKTTTSKGYKIETKDGVTFIDGVLIVNKSYSLPKDYKPELTDSWITPQTQEAFDEMAEAAASDGVKLWVQSGYRSYERQAYLYADYVEREGKEAADTFSARPGYSEHQSGLAFDINQVGDSFKDTKEGEWIAQNCFKYGFIIRFPEDKSDITGYKYESWHLRYVGKELAEELHKSGECLEEHFGITSQYEDEEN